MQKIRTSVTHDRAQIILRRMKVLLTFLHPVQTKRGGMIFEPVQTVHPGGLMRKGNFSKADERDLRSVGHQARNQFARVRPNSAERVSRDQYAHRTPGIRGLGATLGLPAYSLGSMGVPREEFSCGRGFTELPERAIPPVETRACPVSANAATPVSTAISQGIVNLKTEPRPDCGSTQILPPQCSTIFLQMASPIPLPGYSARVCRRWKTTKTFSACSGPMPLPLSLTLNNHCSPAFSACTEIT